MSQTTIASQTSSQKQNAESIKASFELTSGGSKKTVMIHKPRIVIGSIETADVKISETPGVAPIHAVVELVWGNEVSACSAMILDLASPSGVFVNGQKVVHHQLKNGDQVKLGDASFIFEFKKPTARDLLPDQALLLIEEDSVETIFDYRPEAKDTLEAAFSWNDCILDVDHLTDVDSMIVPPVYQNGAEVNLAQKVGNRWNLVLTPAMKGVLYINGELKTVESLRQSGKQVSLGENDFAKIESGSVSIYLSQTIAPPVLRKKTTIVTDPFLAKSMLASIALTIMIIFGVSRLDPPAEVVEPTPAVVVILDHPENYPKQPKFNKPAPKPPVEKVAEAPKPVEPPKPVEVKPKVDPKPTQLAGGKPQKAQDKAKEGEGARAKGAEGSRGAKNARPDKTKQTAAKRPSPNAGEGRGGTQSQVADNGNVQMMKGATSKILDLLGGSGKAIGKSGSKLAGFGGFDTRGEGGAGLQGTGKGGGGNADTLLGGLGDKGRGGGKVGTGLGADGTGTGIVGGAARVELNMGNGSETVVIGAIDKDAIDAAIKAHRDELRYCYENEINTGGARAAGKVIASMTIGASGKASQLAIASSSINNPKIERCVLKVLERVQFPLPGGGVPVSIKYPFGFTNANK